MVVYVSFLTGGGKYFSAAVLIRDSIINQMSIRPGLRQKPEGVVSCSVRTTLRDKYIGSFHSLNGLRDLLGCRYGIKTVENNYLQSDVP